MPWRDWGNVSVLGTHRQNFEGTHTRVRNSQVAHQSFHGLREDIASRSWYDQAGQNPRSLDPISPLCWTMHILAVQALAF